MAAFHKRCHSRCPHEILVVLRNVTKYARKIQSAALISVMTVSLFLTLPLLVVARRLNIILQGGLACGAWMCWADSRCGHLFGRHDCYWRNMCLSWGSQPVFSQHSDSDWDAAGAQLQPQCHHWSYSPSSRPPTPQPCDTAREEKTWVIQHSVHFSSLGPLHAWASVSLHEMLSTAFRWPWSCTYLNTLKD